jgi:hypothetical protein
MSYSFNGSNQRLTMGNIYGDSPTEISMSIWVRRNGAQTNRAAFAASAGNHTFFRLFIDASTQPQFSFRNSSFSQQFGITRTGALDDLTWTHFCGTATTNSAVFYVNGTSAGTDTSVSMSGNNPTITSIGAYDANGLGSWQQHFAGDLAEAAIWLGVLNAAQVTSLAKGMSADKVAPDKLTFYAPLVRNIQDVSSAITITNNNTATVAAHPRVYA